MKAYETYLTKLLSQPSQFRIPLWQRQYAWTDEDCERLVEDILSVGRRRREAVHFIGSIITLSEAGAPAGDISVHRVVDGQQRLITTNLLMLAIADVIESEPSAAQTWTATKIRQQMTGNGQETGDARHKLRLQEVDQGEYLKIWTGKGGAAGGRIGNAYRCLSRNVRRVFAEDGSIEALIDGLRRVMIVTIGVTPDEAPQQIFEALNTTGKPLREHEKLRNGLMLGHSEDEQRRILEEVWRVIVETVCGGPADDAMLDRFLLDTYRRRSGKIGNVREGYRLTKRWMDAAELTGTRGGEHALMAEAQWHGAITGRTPHEDNQIRAAVDRIRPVGGTAWTPMGMRILADKESGIAKSDVLKALNAVERWLWRRYLVGREGEGLNRLATTEAARALNATEGYADGWRQRIGSLRGGTSRVPTDEEILRDGRDSTRYGGKTSEITRALLWQLEQADAKDAVKPVGQLTLEHVLPQQPTKTWLEDLGDDAEETVRSRTHVLGNLTLVPAGWNRSAGQQRFNDKRVLYEKTGIYETSWRVARETHWGRGKIDARGERLLRAACTLWPWDGPWPEPTQGWQRWRVRYRHAQGEWVYANARRTLLEMVGTILRRDTHLSSEEIARREASQHKLVEEGLCAEQEPERGKWGQVEGVPGLVVWIDRSYTVGISYVRIWKRLMQEDGQLEVETDAGQRDGKQPKELWPWRSAWEIEDRGGLTSQA